MDATPGTPEQTAVMPWRGVLAGLSAMLVGIGLSRFAYTPILPALIDAGWFKASEAAYLGAANLAGYLAGALVAQPVATRFSMRAVIRAMMVVATIAFFASATPLSFAWYFLWRFASGVTGGVLMVLAASAILPHVPARRRGLAGGIIFTGVGLGIAASGTIVPAMMRFGLTETWVALGAAALALTVFTWGGWPDDPPSPRHEKELGSPARARPAGAILALYAVYCLTAFGLVPQMIFLVDFVARGLSQGLAIGSAYWVLVGLGSIAGPALAGRLGDRIGFGPGLRLLLVLQAACAGWLAVSGDTVGLIVTSLITGGVIPGVVPLVLGRVHDLLPNDPARRTVVWSGVTASFALGQAASAYAYSYLYARSESYEVLFAGGAAALILALVIDLTARSNAKRRL